MPICLYDQEGYFRGPAVFETKKDAQNIFVKAVIRK
jgi:hypothetical protein